MVTHPRWYGAFGKSGNERNSSPLAANRYIAAKIAIAPLTSARAVALFAEAVDRTVLADGIRIAPEVAALARTLRFAFALVAGKHVLPGLAAGPQPHARWQPVLGAAERVVYDAIVATFPPIAAALTPTHVSAAPSFDIRPAFDTALAFLVDAAMRMSVSRPPALSGANPSIHTRWMAALTGSRSTFDATAAELAELEAAVEAWRRPVVEERAATYRLCLRVEEPAADAMGPSAARWHVRYLLQSRAHPTLFVPGDRAIRSSALRREYLTALGRAAPFSRRIDASLDGRAMTPTGFALDTAAAFAFLQSEAPACAAADIGVILPSWWLGMDAKARVGLRAVVKRVQTLALLARDWERDGAGPVLLVCPNSVIGGVAKRARDTMVDGFQGRSGAAAFVLSLKAGGSGRNLTRANHVFHYDRWWNPAVENQATDRALEPQAVAD